MRLTSYQMIGNFVKQNGAIIPAHVVGSWYAGQKWSSQTDKRCRELRARGILVSEPAGKYEKFSFNKDLGSKINLLEDYAK